MEALIDIACKAIADNCFRQAVQWSPQDVAVRWDLSPRETTVLQGPVRDALDALPIPVEPADIPAEQERFGRLIGDSLGATQG